MSDDPYGTRQPTSHERMAGRPWNESYSNGPAPWELGRPQPAVVRLVSDGAFTGSVLDAGCGSGDNAVLIASSGVPVLGFDVAETALARAREKAAERGVEAEFVAADALRLGDLGRTFDTILDSGLFHTFDAGERAQYVVSLASAAKPGATLYVLCFSDADPDDVPHPISQVDLHTAFDADSGWTLGNVEATRIGTRMHANGAPGWLATVRRN
ncbi:class I SAM-dependent methyltransferase [Kribbella sp. NPDC051586]|uniref:class I SAM-dependent methyltransferase n=1 Tax=Kribbella sp. NPDC051586 TaxID=3364118 RepID=UPI0037B1CA0F